jgi:phosphatidylethanolamine-binding protein (PEBP) family uncharacterized protein
MARTENETRHEDFQVVGKAGFPGFLTPESPARYPGHKVPASTTPHKKSPKKAPGDANVALILTSQAFENANPIPRRYTCEGDDISPPLEWAGIPSGTKSLALLVEDPDAPDPANPKRVWVHWVLYDIPGPARTLPDHGVELARGVDSGHPVHWLPGD